MNIISAQYTLSMDGETTTAIKIALDGAEMHVPLDPDNRHYAEIMRQVDAGTLTIQEAD